MQNLPDRIALIGMMGAGKSTIGKLLAARLNYSFADLDQYIVEKEGRSISSIFESQGRSYFRSLENAALLDFSGVKKLLLATGGGAPTTEPNRILLEENFFTIHLVVDPAVAARRLLNERFERPLISSCQSLEEIEESMFKIWETRKDFYRMARIEIDVSALTKEEAAQQCFEGINRFLNLKPHSSSR